MQNILLISIIYPLPSKDNKGTSVCHFFTREWVKIGLRVRVVHIQAVYPLILYWIARLNSKRIAAKTGAVVYTRRLNHVENYIMDEVPIMRIPVFKPIPHGKFNHNSIKKAIQYIVDDCQGCGFIPDIILGHFPNPQIEMVGLLKDIYPLAKTGIVMHGDTDIMNKVYGKRLPELMKSIDVWGFRSKTIKDDFERVVGKVKNPFICYSGIPEKYITRNNVHSFEKPLQRYVYVGEMIERKYPEKVIEALHKAYPEGNFRLTYIGAGHQLDIIRLKVNEYSLHSQVEIIGRIPRDQIVEEYDKADCMVMISKGEAYGLVYLEAMARGCITIASKREGFDGVIIDGENGFLCEAGNSDELASIIKRINCISPERRQRISENAIATAKKLTDEKTAKLYIDDVIARIK